MDIIKRRKATVDWEALWPDVIAYLEGAGGDNWRELFIPILQGVIADQAATWAAAMGMEFDIANLLSQDWFDAYTLKFAQEINKTTKDGLAGMFKQATGEGWTVSQMEDRIETMFTQWMKGDKTSADFDWYDKRMPLWRRENIARTESMRSLNAGAYYLHRSWNVPMKEWLAAFDDRTRDDHRDAGMRYVEGGSPGPIAMDKPFTVGINNPVQMMYPGDPSAPPEQVCNCRCTIAPYNPLWAGL